MALYKDGVLTDDPAAPDAAAGRIVGLAEWRAMRETAPGSNAPLGVRIEPGESLDEIVPDLPRLALVALPFPKFNDGRSFSKARMLRQTHGFAGEIRAVGDVLWDQLQLMSRCGFDAFEITNEPTLKALRAGKRPVMTAFYQPASGPETREGAPRLRAWARHSPG